MTSTTACRTIRPMSDAEWEEAYKAAWDAYFTWEHMETVTRRHARLEGGRPKKALQYLIEFRLLYANEGVHTLEGGVVRRKRRRSRRPTMQREPALALLSEVRLRIGAQGVELLARLPPRRSRCSSAILADPARHDYSDLATRPLMANELEVARSLPRNRRRRGRGRQGAAAGGDARRRPPSRTRRPPDRLAARHVSAAGGLRRSPSRCRSRRQPRSAQDCTGRPSATRLIVTVSNVRAAQGLIAVTLYADDSSRFLARRGSLYVGRVPARAGVTRVCIHVPRPGLYGLAVYHDATPTGASTAT